MVGAQLLISIIIAFQAEGTSWEGAESPHKPDDREKCWETVLHIRHGHCTHKVTAVLVTPTRVEQTWANHHFIMDEAHPSLRDGY